MFVAMGQDIHAYLQDGARGIEGRIAVGRDPFLFGLLGVGGAAGQHPGRHDANGLPAILAHEIAADLLVAADVSADGGERYHLAADGALRLEADGPLAVHPDYHSVGHLDVSALGRVLGIWSGSVDYGYTSARPLGAADPRQPEDPEVERVITETLGPEVEVPWWEQWAGLPGPQITDSADLVRLVMRGALARDLLEPALEKLRADANVELRRYARRPPQMGDRWRKRGPHPTLAPALERMCELEAADGAPLLVVFFDN